MANCKSFRELVATSGLGLAYTLLKPKPKYAPLEERIIRAEKFGQEWAAAYETWLQLDEAKKSVLADLQKDLDDGEKSEAKLERLARASKTYKDFITNLCLAKGAEIRARVKYDCAVSWYEAARTRESTERVKMQVLRDIP